MRHAILALCAAAVLAEPLPAQTVARPSEEQIRANWEADRGDFDYLLGDWEFTSVSREHGPGQGYWSAVRLDDGQIVDEYRVVGDTGQYVTTTDAHGAALRRAEPGAVALAHPLLRHSPGRLLVGRGPYAGQWRHLGAGRPDHPGAPHRPGAHPPRAGARAQPSGHGS